MMALANLESSTVPRNIHLFDTFAGIPEPNADVDGDRAIREAEAAGMGIGGKLVPNPEFYTQMNREIGYEEDSRDLLGNVVGYPMDRVHYHTGFFEETIPTAGGSLEAIGFLHLDCDWYRSTKVALDHLYDLVVPGGWIQIDDYGTYEGCRRAVDEFLGSRSLMPDLARIDAEVCAFVKV